MSRSEPVFFVRVLPEGLKGERIDLSDQVTSFVYEDNERKADKLKLSVINWDLSNFDDPVWKKGTSIECSWGYPGNMAPPRLLQIRKVSGFSNLKIEAHGLEVTMNRETKCRIFEGMTRSDAVRQIASENGYKTEDVVHIEDTEIVHEFISQARLTDAQFIRRLAHKEGYEWYVDFDGFHFHSRDMTQKPVRIFNYYENPDQSEISAISIDNDVTAKPGKVKMCGRDPLTKKDLCGEADNDSEKKRGVLADVLEVIDLESGESKGLKKIAHEDTRPTSEESEAAAKREAGGRFRRAQQVAVKLSFTAQGDPRVAAKMVFETAGMGKRLSQKYYVRMITHTIGSGYRIKIKSVSDGHGGHSTKSKRVDGLSGIQVGPAAKGRRGQNADKDKDKDKDNPGELAAFDQVDLESGDTNTVYRETAGRPAPEKQGQNA